MRSLESWGTLDRRVLLCLAENVLDVFEKHVQATDDSRESGGILLGSLRGTHLEIVEATTPSRLDGRSRFLFIRRTFWHRWIAESRWRSSGGTVRYLGEWHTHPEDHPRPSSIDKKEWRRLAATRQDGRPLLAIIVGREGLHMELVESTGQRIVLEPVR